MTDSVLLCLEIKPAGDSLTGRARDASGTTKEFSGWLGLTAAIDALISRATQAEGRSAGRNLTNDGEDR
jgi:hypothetical protein